MDTMNINYKYFLWQGQKRPCFFMDELFQLWETLFPFSV